MIKKEFYTLEKCPSYYFNQCNFTIFGRSKPADRTGFMIKDYGILFDAGINTYIKPYLTLITNTHNDHSCALSIIMNRQEHYSPVYLPYECVDLMKTFLDSKTKLSNCDILAQFNNKNLILGTTPGDIITYRHKNKQFVVDVVNCYHTIPTVGYIISEIRNKLLPEFLSMSNNEIKILKQKGVKITHSVIFPLLSFISDTDDNFFTDIHIKQITQCSVVFIECSYYMDNDLHLSQKNKNIHWYKLKPVVLHNPSTLFVLFHFSLKYNEVDIIDYFNKENIKILLWLDSRVVEINF